MNEVPQELPASPLDHAAALECAMEMLYSTYSREELAARDKKNKEGKIKKGDQGEQGDQADQGDQGDINAIERKKAVALGFESVEEMLDFCLKAVTRLEGAKASNPHTFPPAKKDFTPIATTGSAQERPMKVANMAGVTLAIIERIVRDENSVVMKKDDEATPYYQIIVTQKGCNRHIFVNEAVSNATYIFDPDKLPDGESIDSLMAMNKDEIFTFTKDHPECALRLIKRGNWPKRLIEALALDLAKINAKDNAENVLTKSDPDDGSYVDAEGFHWASNKTLSRLVHMDYDSVKRVCDANNGSVRVRRKGGDTLYCVEDIKLTPELVDRQERTLTIQSEHGNFHYREGNYITWRGLCLRLGLDENKSGASYLQSILIRMLPESSKIQVYYEDGTHMARQAYLKDDIERLDVYQKLIQAEVKIPNNEGWIEVNGKKYGPLSLIVRDLFAASNMKHDVRKATPAVYGMIQRSGTSMSIIEVRLGKGTLGISKCYARDDEKIAEYVRVYRPIST